MPQKKTIWDLHRPDAGTALHAGKLPVTVVLDNVRSLNNIGSIFRTADGLGMTSVALCGISATPPSPEIHKTALGAEESVPWSYWADTTEAIRHLKETGHTICVLEQVHGSTDLRDWTPEPGHPYAIVAGHEVHGVSPEVVDMADICLEIPQVGMKHSLNVAVSTALAMWRYFETAGSASGNQQTQTADR